MASKDVSSRQNIELSGIKIPLGSHLSPIILKDVERGGYELAELNILRQVIEPNDVVMELGTGIGFLSAWCAKIVGASRVFSYEANPDLEPHILKLYEANGVRPELKFGILGRNSGVTDFYLEPNFWGSSTILGSPQSKKIQVVSLNFQEHLAAIKPTLMLIDIEGGEYDLLMSNDLEGVGKLVIELHGPRLGKDKVAEIHQRLIDQGFQLNRRHSYTLKRRAFLAIADLIGRSPTEFLLSAVGLHGRSDEQESRYYNR